MRADLGDAATDGLVVVVVLEGGLDREGMGSGVLDEGALDVDGGQVAAERHGPGPDDGIEGQPQFCFKVVQAQQPHLQYQLGADDAVVQRRVAAGEEYALVRQVPAAHVLLDDPVAGEQVVHVLDEGDHADALGEELAHEVLDGLAVEERLVLLPHDDLPIVGLDQRYLFRGGHHGHDDLLDRGDVLVAVEAAGHVPGRGHALQGLHHGLAHVALDTRVGDAEGEGYVTAKLKTVAEEVRVPGEQLPHHLVVGFLAFRVPHLLIAAHGEDTDGLLDLPFPLQHPRLVGEGRAHGIVRVLGAHHLGHCVHGASPGLPCPPIAAL